MSAVNLADAKAHLSDIVARAEAGEPIEISRRGKAVVRISRLGQGRKPIQLAMLRALTDSMPESAADSVVPAMRAEARY